MGFRLRFATRAALGLGLAAAVAAVAADDHLLLCEGEIKGTYSGQQTDFVEIVNPTAETVDLSHYLLSDHKHYYRLPAALGGTTDPPTYTGADFTVRFPFGANIGPGETRIVAMDAVAFEAAYGRWPDFEIRRPPDTGHPAVPDMLEAYPGAIEFEPGFAGDGEYVVLFYWDSADLSSDLVQDVDIARLGSPPASGNNDIPDKSGLAVDGPDVGSAATPYPPQAMDMDQPPTDPGVGKSTKRLLLEGPNESAGGSGKTGDDETSEKIARTWDGACGEFEDRDLSGRTVGSTQTFTACRTLRAGDFAVISPGKATLEAGTSITLDDEVAIEVGCELVLDLDPSLAAG